MNLKNIAGAAASVACLALLLSPTMARDRHERSAVRSIDCDRACLTGILNQYMEAMVSHEPGRLAWAEQVKFTENGVAMQIGDGLWGTINKQKPYKLYFIDPQQGQAALFGVVVENTTPSLYSLRLKIENGKIAEAETMVVRKALTAFANADAVGDQPLPILTEAVPAERRLSREQLITHANAYFQTLEQNDGTLYAQFDKDCNRLESGMQTTNNAAMANSSNPGTLVMALGCQQQFESGFFKFVTRIRDRRFFVVDEEQQLVFASAFFDHAGVMRKVTLSDGKTVPAQFDIPFTWQIGELFKIKDRKIRQIQALVMTAPYNMPDVWNH